MPLIKVDPPQQTVKHIEFTALAIGEAFTYYGHLYMKTKVADYSRPQSHNAFCFSNYVSHTFKGDEIVLPKKARIVVDK